jgi:hypothetical protein
MLNQPLAFLVCFLLAPGYNIGTSNEHPSPREITMKTVDGISITADVYLSAQGKTAPVILLFHRQAAMPVESMRLTFPDFSTRDITSLRPISEAGETDSKARTGQSLHWKEGSIHTAMLIRIWKQPSSIQLTTVLPERGLYGEAATPRLSS